ncbi:flagellar assembly protein FliH [Lachnospiraceae bacterium KM106-2]|nr:flagellar assembly protein FliH [Lachnospiraceae bacterium KM106-2]
MKQNDVKVIETNWQSFVSPVSEVSDAGENLQEGTFQSGLEVKEVANYEEEEERHREQMDALLAVAKNEAEQIVNQAKEEAEAIRIAAVEDGEKQGYEQGLEQASEEIARKKEELERKLAEVDDIIEEEKAKLEPQFVSVMIDLIESITGVLIKEHEDMILYLLKKGMRGMEKCDEVSVRISEEDYEFVTSKQSVLIEQLGENTILDIVKDETLSKNQCFIDTKDKKINCSLDLQLSGLITDLKLLSKC